MERTPPNKKKKNIYIYKLGLDIIGIIDMTEIIDIIQIYDIDND